MLAIGLTFVGHKIQASEVPSLTMKPQKTSYLGPYIMPKEHGLFDLSLLLDTKKTSPKTCSLVLGEKVYRQSFVASMGDQWVIVKFINLALKPQTPYTIMCDNKALFSGTTPLQETNKPLRFFAYGDTREGSMGTITSLGKIFTHNRKGFDYVQKQSIFIQMFDYIYAFMKYRQAQPALHLITGDLTMRGKYDSQLSEFLYFANPTWKNQVVQSAVGNHDIDSVHFPFGDKEIVPHFGNLFYFNKPVDTKQAASKYLPKMSRSFDITNGSDTIRFIHLPYIEKDIMAKTKTDFIATFINQLEKACKDRASGKISFIITYGHQPLVSSPTYEPAHIPLFDTENLKSWINPLIKAFKSYKPDTYICGHNHVYDRTVWGGIPMITVGTGTGLHKSSKRRYPHTIVAQETAIGKKYYDRKDFPDGLISFLDLIVDSTSKSIKATLYGSPYHKKHTPTEYQILDTFEIPPQK